MKRLRLPRMTLLNRIVCFMAAFCVVLLLQIGIGNYQTVYVLVPLEERTQNIQSISQFLNDVEGCMQALESYRWDYGETDVLVSTLRTQQESSVAHLEQIDSELGQVSEEQYLLANAAITTYRTFSSTVDQIVELMQAGRVDEAAALYYNKAEPCGGYLRQYTQQLLERAIQNNQSAHAGLTALNERLNQIQNVTAVVCLYLGVVVVASLLSLLRSVRNMAQASQAISRGELDVPDVDEAQRDEIGDMAKAFNEMKHSMKRQVELLEEKNEMERELHKKEREALELQNLMEREKLQKLRSQINPHFLFNTLNVIMYTSQQEGAAKTQELIGSLSRLFRYALASNDTQVPLSREVHIVNELYSLQHARFGDRVQMKWHISPEVDLTETMVPSFILQPLVENSFKHGIGPKEGGGCVDIEIEIVDDMLRINVSDDGVGMTEEKLEDLRENLRNPSTTGEHIGVYNVAARLQLWGSGCGFEIQSRSGKGTSTVLTLPLVMLGEDEEDLDD